MTSSSLSPVTTASHAKPTSEQRSCLVIEASSVDGGCIPGSVTDKLTLVEFPADEPERALRFWSGVLGVELEERGAGQGQGWQARFGGTELGVHARGRGPGDRVSLPYFSVPDLGAAVTKVTELGGS